MTRSRRIGRAAWARARRLIDRLRGRTETGDPSARSTRGVTVARMGLDDLIALVRSERDAIVPFVGAGLAIAVAVVVLAAVGVVVVRRHRQLAGRGAAPPGLTTEERQRRGRRKGGAA